MIIYEWIRMLLGFSLLILSVTIFAIEIIGVFKMKFSLNRMHAAAMGDTLGLGSGLLGLMIISGLNFTTLKMLLVWIFLWCTSPVASHLIARMEYETNDNLSGQAQHAELLEVEAEIGERKEQEL
ncbi:MAG: monovalent cation/H(+) antiporter subunit G [Lachnospiraceae bacterium]|nr:monovalent cation/H(+) antiporter subunit G [Lachnospiraceae bacterium]